MHSTSMHRHSQTPAALSHVDARSSKTGELKPTGTSSFVTLGEELKNGDHPPAPDDWISNPPFRWSGPPEHSGEEGKNVYMLECYCKRVQFTISSEPLDVKICHCDTCKTLHGAPMQAAAIFYKTDARLTKGSVGDIAFFSASLPNPRKTLYATPCPRKISCTSCGSPLADEGQNMFIVFPSSLRYHGRTRLLPPAFNVRKHIFYGQRVFDMYDRIEKWEALDGKSGRMTDDGSIMEVEN